MHGTPWRWNGLTDSRVARHSREPRVFALFSRRHGGTTAYCKEPAAVSAFALSSTSSEATLQSPRNSHALPQVTRAWAVLGLLCSKHSVGRTNTSNMTRKGRELICYSILTPKRSTGAFSLPIFYFGPTPSIVTRLVLPRPFWTHAFRFGGYRLLRTCQRTSHPSWALLRLIEMSFSFLQIFKQLRALHLREFDRFEVLYMWSKRSSAIQGSLVSLHLENRRRSRPRRRFP